MTDKTLTREDFEKHLNTVFSCPDAEGGTVELLLIETSTPSFKTDSNPRAPFSLLFKEAKAAGHGQQTFPLHHPEMGDVAMFLVPIAQDESGMTYEACFN